MNFLTGIHRIGAIRQSGNDSVVLTKSIFLNNDVTNAVIRLESYGVCGIFINGRFFEGNTGRYANRIACFECTSFFHKGENTVSIKLDGHYFQQTHHAILEQSGKYISCVAAEINIDGIITVTDSSWQCDGEAPTVFSQITKAEYDRFWTTAALWDEIKPISPNSAINDLLGTEYTDFINDIDDVITLDNIIDQGDGYVVFDAHRLIVGYMQVDYTAQGDGEITLLFDYTESLDDFYNGHSIAQRLSITKKLKSGTDTLIVLHRRAFRYLKISYSDNVTFKGARLKVSMKHYNRAGYFSSDDALLNELWRVGRYTLLVNKHQEYESCPRNEMKYFSGDAILEALVDYYTYGDPSLTDASFALTEIDSNLGIRHNRFDRNISLWDYPAWRIISAYNHYKFFADADFVKRNYDELAVNMTWLTDKMNERGLIYQFPCFAAPFYGSSSPVEYSSSTDRLGEKPSLNALLYKSLLCMSELAQLMNDSRGNEWLALAQTVKDAINTYLWSEEKGAYLDTYYPDDIFEDGNALAVLFGIADSDRARRVLLTLKNEVHTPYGASVTNSRSVKIRGELGTISPVMNTYEAEAHFIYGNEADALDLIRACWGTMYKKGARTFWEFAPANDTGKWPIAAHGWASGCTYLLSAYVLGIRPDGYGYEKVIFAPAKTIEAFKGCVPTVKGDIAVKRENGKYTLIIPKDIEVIDLSDGETEIIKY